VNSTSSRRLVSAALLAVVALMAIPSSSVAYTVVCADGWISQSGGKQGACSHHGGVAGPYTPSPSLTPPVVDTDFTPPTISLPAGSTVPAFARTGAATAPFSVAFSDNQAFPAAVSALITWGDGLTDVVTTSATATFATVIVPAHTYTLPGIYTVIVSITDAAGNSASTPVGTIHAMTVPSSVSRPTVTGSHHVGRTLTRHPGTWAGSPTAYSMQWLSRGHRIPGATSPTFTVRSRDHGKLVTCVVTATNQAGTASATAPPVRVRR
jgi:hypothetical protein